MKKNVFLIVVLILNVSCMKNGYVELQDKKIEVLEKKIDDLEKKLMKNVMMIKIILK